MVHKTVNEAFTNHNPVLANTIGNVLKQVFFRALIDQVGPAYFNGFNPSAMGSSVPSSSQQPNDGQFQQPPMQQLLGGQALDLQAQPTTGGKVKLNQP